MSIPPTPSRPAKQADQSTGPFVPFVRARFLCPSWLRRFCGLRGPQIVPRILPQLMQEKDPEKRNRVMKALLKMVKLDIAELQQAAAPASTKPQAESGSPKR